MQNIALLSNQAWLQFTPNSFDLTNFPVQNWTSKLKSVKKLLNRQSVKLNVYKI